MKVVNYKKYSSLTLLRRFACRRMKRSKVQAALCLLLFSHHHQHWSSLLSSSIRFAHSFALGSYAFSGQVGATTPRKSCSPSPFVSYQKSSGICPSPSSSSLLTVSRKTAAALSSSSSLTTKEGEAEDPYLWLEEVESTESLDWCKAANAECLETLGDPKASSSYDRILAVLESDDRIPYVTQYGQDPNDEKKEHILYNFWKDKANPKGLWRRTTPSSYKSTSPEWTTVLNLDELAKQDEKSWVWKGSTALPRSRDLPITSANEGYAGTMVTRSLLSLSNGGSDAVEVKEFDHITGTFVPEKDQPFILKEAKSRVSYKSRDVLLVGTDLGEPGDMTDSGYPRRVREWVRGTNLEDAPIVFEGEATDVSVGQYISDERTWAGPIYEVRYRTLTFYSTKKWVRILETVDQLLLSSSAEEAAVSSSEFVELQVQDDAEASFQGKLLMISLRSDWVPIPSGSTYKRGSLIYCNAVDFVEIGKEAVTYTILFQPTDRTAYEYFTVTKNYLILGTMDTIRSKLDFYKISDDGEQLTNISNSFFDQPIIRDCSIRPIDPYSGSDEFWFTSSDFTTPSTLYMANAKLVEDEQSGAKSPTADFHDKDPFIVCKLKSLPEQFDSKNLVVDQAFATSKDGTQVPYFIIHHKYMVKNGQNPTLQYGYGGFEVSLGPSYLAVPGLAWLEPPRSGVYVLANIRGGGEFGPSWHQAALKENRIKAYEDFIAVAEHLIATNICSSETLAIRGGSNGGMLMGNMYTMRPDLFGAVQCSVPLLDMKRYSKLLAGASWMAEYGDPDTDDWKFLKQYSAYHNIDPNADYPPILVTTSTRDDRVHPGHARKFVKKLLDLGKGRWPVHYYENIEGGHGMAADAKQSAFMTALSYDFMYETLIKNMKN